MRSIKVFDPGESGWLVLHMDDGDFESSVNQVCGFILKGDKRMGKIHNRKRKS